MFKRILMTLAVLASFIAPPAFAQTGLLSFAAPAYDARHGGTQVTLDELRSNPAAYYRSAEAYDMARTIIGWAVGKPLTDKGFKRLLGSDRISVANCTDVFSGTFTLAAVDAAGKAFWAPPRACDAGEQIVMLDGKTAIMSLACLNAIKAPAAAKPVATIMPSSGGNNNPPPPSCEELNNCEPPTCEELGNCTPPPPPPCGCDEEDDHDGHDNHDHGNHGGGHGNNGWGNGDQDPPGNSGDHNGAENDSDGGDDPSHGGKGRGKDK